MKTESVSPYIASEPNNCKISKHYINEFGVKNDILVYKFSNNSMYYFFFDICYLSRICDTTTTHNLFKYDKIKKILNTFFCYDLTKEILKFILESDYSYSATENMVKYNRKKASEKCLSENVE